MHRRLLTALLAAIAIQPFTTHAEDIGYGYVDLAYVHESPDAGSDGDGFGVGLSASLHPHIHAFAAYKDISFDAYQIFPAVDGTTWDLGVGWNGGLGQRADLVVRAGYVDYEIDIAGARVGNEGYEFSGGFRAMVTPKLELNGFVKHLELSDSGDDSGVEGGVFYSFTHRMAAGGRLEVSDVGVTASAILRVYWK